MVQLLSRNAGWRDLWIERRTLHLHPLPTRMDPPFHGETARAKPQPQESVMVQLDPEWCACPIDYRDRQIVADSTSLIQPAFRPQRVLRSIGVR